MGNKLLKILAALLGILLIGVLGFVFWASATPEPMPQAIAALASDENVSVSQDEWLVFTPADGKADAGLIFYPGGKVDPVSYAPAARSIAEAGYQVVIVPMPLNLAFFSPDKADEVIAEFPEVNRWGIAGHSLGGSMAARFVYEHPGEIGGLALWAAYPAGTDDIGDRTLPVTVIFGTQDGLASLDEIEGGRPLLPPKGRWVPIEGGNHAQFGWYGPQSGDNPATISRENQQEQIVEAMLDLLGSLN
jgi:hypothetical protein